MKRKPFSSVGVIIQVLWVSWFNVTSSMNEQLSKIMQAGIKRARKSSPTSLVNTLTPTPTQIHAHSARLISVPDTLLFQFETCLIIINNILVWLGFNNQGHQCMITRHCKAAKDVRIYAFKTAVTQELFPLHRLLILT